MMITLRAIQWLLLELILQGITLPKILINVNHAYSTYISCSFRQQAARVFISAPIVERPGLFTLKTADGISVILKGKINRKKTCENGYSEEVFKHFFVGFPPNWKECAEKCFRQGIGSEATADAGINPELSTVTKMGNADVKLKQNLWKDSDCNSRPDHSRDGKPCQSKKRKRSEGRTAQEKNTVTRTTVDNKNCHDSASPTFRKCTSKARSTPKLRMRRKLDYAQEDHGMSRIREGSTVLKVNSKAQISPFPADCLAVGSKKTSQYKGVTKHSWTRKYEASRWDGSCKEEGKTRKGRKVFLGSYYTEEKAARAWDLAALKYQGPSARTNFPLENYKDELVEMKSLTPQEYVAHLRRICSGFSRGASMYRGVSR